MKFNSRKTYSLRLPLKALTLIKPSGHILRHSHHPVMHGTILPIILDEKYQFLPSHLDIELVRYP